MYGILRQIVFFLLNLTNLFIVPVFSPSSFYSSILVTPLFFISLAKVMASSIGLQTLTFIIHHMWFFFDISFIVNRDNVFQVYSTTIRNVMVGTPQISQENLKRWWMIHFRKSCQCSNLQAFYLMSPQSGFNRIQVVNFIYPHFLVFTLNSFHVLFLAISSILAFT